MKMLLPLFRAGSLLTRLSQARGDLFSSYTEIMSKSTTAATTSNNKLHELFLRQLPPLEIGSRRIFLLRHGETDWNAQGLMQGGGFDIELNESGFEQAALAQKVLQGVPFQIVASSHLERSSQTAQLIHESNTDAVRVIHHKFGEMRFGEFEGIAIRRRQKRDQEEEDEWTVEHERMRQRFMDFNHIVQEHKEVKWPGGGESTACVERRGIAGIQQLLRSFPDADHFCIVAHGRFNKIVMQGLLGITGKDVFQQGNACINVLDVDESGKWKARVINYIQHIESDVAKQAPS